MVGNLWPPNPYTRRVRSAICVTRIGHTLITSDDKLDWFYSCPKIKFLASTAEISIVDVGATLVIRRCQHHAVLSCTSCDPRPILTGCFCRGHKGTASKTDRSANDTKKMSNKRNEGQMRLRYANSLFLDICWKVFKRKYKLVSDKRAM